MTEKKFTLDPSNTFACVVVRNDESKLLSKMGHDHVIRASDFSSTISLDLDDPGSWKFAMEFPTASMVVDEDEDRRRVNLDGTVSERDRRATADNMRARNQLHAKKHREIRFEVDGARGESEGQWLLNATLWVRGQRCDFEFPVALSVDSTLQVAGRAELTHRDLGMKPYKAPMGALRNREELLFIVDIEAAPL